jgi:hypothetical protein
MAKRYKVDRRVGCIAVIDTTIESDCPGLHPDSIGVVKYWSGRRIEHKCPTCGHVSHSEWEVPEETVKEAQKLCDELNSTT